MTLVQLIQLALVASVFMTVFGFGLNAPLSDATLLFERPGLLFRSLMSMNVVMVVFAVAVASFFNLAPEIKIAIVALSVSPVPPLLARRQEDAGGSRHYTVGLLVAAVVLSIVLVPGWIELLGRYFGVDAHIPPSKVAQIAAITAIVPLTVGMLVHRFAPGLAKRIRTPVGRAANILLVVSILPVVLKMAGPIWSMIGNNVLIVLVSFTLVGLAVGHVLGGPNPDDRTVLALATGTRHPGMAMAIAGLNFPEQKANVLVVVLLHLIVAMVLAVPYQIWRRRSHAADVAAAERRRST